MDCTYGESTEDKQMVWLLDFRDTAEYNELGITAECRPWASPVGLGNQNEITLKPLAYSRGLCSECE